MKKFIKKPVTIEAIQWTGHNLEEIKKFSENTAKKRTNLVPEKELNQLLIHTEEGVMIANLGDWIIKGVKGEFYPCKPDIFKMTYKELNENRIYDNIEKCDCGGLIIKTCQNCGETFE